MKHVFKILRVTAWLLLVITILTIFSGFVLSKYPLIDFTSYGTAYFFHVILMPVIFIPLFYIHSICGVLILCKRINKRRQSLYGSLILFLLTLTFVLFAVLYFSSVPSTSAKDSKPAVFLGTTKNSSVLTFKEVSKHNTPSDCYLIISGRVFDVSSYISLHPGGSDTIIPYCGKDATDAFKTKNKGKPHSMNAKNLLESYFIGEIGSTKKEINVTNTKTAVEEKIKREMPGAEILKVKQKKLNDFDVDVLFEGEKYKVKIRGGEIEKVEKKG
ncbi:cytochrome b5 domain-containing protein [Candidatus Pacearchaeota archaeon]|nr:MAG: cytochrome b5 domain-containing protein [Candidatus Pacearchaeota archaeon]